MSRWILVAMIVVGVIALGGLAIVSSAATPAVGSDAPQFTLNSQDGTAVSLKDFKGKWVVLYFYPKDMTSGCTRQAKLYERDQAKFTEKNAVVLGVSTDDEKSHKEFCTKEGLSFKLLADTKHDVAKAYGSLGTGSYAERNTFIIDPNGKIARVSTSVDPTKDCQNSLAALNELRGK
jgi:thioredoxin-dependent peroxiredoxin